MAVFSDSSSDARMELLLRRADFADALAAAERPQRRRRNTALAVLSMGVLALVMGMFLNSGLLLYAVLAFQVPVFGVGFYLMAGQKVRNLRREVAALDKDLKALEEGEE
jgi:hypothetical protein